MALWLQNGTVAITHGQTVVVGTGTTFKTALNPAQTGQPIIIRTASGLDIYEIESVQDDTHLTLAAPVLAATAGSLQYIIPVTIQGSFAALANRAALVMSELNGLVKADQNLSELTQPDVALGHLGLSAFAVELIKLANADQMAGKLNVLSLSNDQTIAGIKRFNGTIQLGDGVSITNKGGNQVIRPSGANGDDTVIGSLSGSPFLYAKDGVAYIQDGPNNFNRIYYEGYKPTPDAIGAFDKEHTMGIASYDADINDIRTSGVYKLSSATQGPKPSDISDFQGDLIEVFEWDSNAGNQVLYPYNGARPYYRNRQGSNWGAWRGLWTSTDFAFSTGDFVPIITVEDVGTMPAPNNHGRYTRIGNCVIVSGVVYITDKGNWAKRMIIGGFPFAGISSGAGSNSAVSLVPFNMACGGQITGTYSGSGGGIDLEFIPAGQSLRNLTAGDLTYVGTDIPLIQFHFSYFIANQA